MFSSYQKMEKYCKTYNKTFEIFYTEQPGHNEKEEFQCPYCKETYTIYASNTPIIL